MTMAAMERLKYIQRRGSWNLIVDEAPAAVFHQRFSLMENRGHLLDLFDARPWNAAYTVLNASENHTSRLVDAARNMFEDEITHHVSEVANKLLSDHWQCFAPNDQLAAFRTVENSKNAIDIFALLQPSV